MKPDLGTVPQGAAMKFVRRRPSLQRQMLEQNLPVAEREPGPESPAHFSTACDRNFCSGLCGLSLSRLHAGTDDSNSVGDRIVGCPSLVTHPFIT